MHELDRLARVAKWSNAELAERLGVHPTMLNHLRSGRNQFSSKVLGRIARLFELPDVERLIIRHLREERDALDAAALPICIRNPQLGDIDTAAVKAIRRYVVNFARIAVETGHGLFLQSADTERLALAARFIHETIGGHGLNVVRVAANARLVGSERQTALCAALLIVERVDHVTAAMTDVLRDRANVVKPIVATSITEPTAVSDPYLVRTFVSMLRRVVLDPADPSLPRT